jgi:hypothetical protein
MLDTLPPASPLDSLSEYLDRWAAAHLACEPANRSQAEEGVRLAYATAGLEPPERIVWCGSPLDIAGRLASVGSTDRVGPNVKVQIFDHVRQKVGTFAEVFWKEVVIAATQLTDDGRVGAALHGYDACRAVSAAVNRIVRNTATDDLARLTIRARHVLLRLRGKPRFLPRGNFDEVAVGPHDLASLGVYEYLHDVLAWREPTQPLRGLWAIAKNGGWIVPHEHVCWISERPSELRTDGRGRLHCQDGPALSYPDGWSAYVWKGVQVPGWMIEHPEWITAAKIADMFEPVLRNCMIEIITPECFVKTGTVERVCEDETGILWRKLWSFRGVAIGSWSAVEVVNGTAEEDGSRKRYFLRVPSHVRTAREAVAWTYGLTDRQYADLELRT